MTRARRATGAGSACGAPSAARGERRGGDACKPMSRHMLGAGCEVAVRWHFRRGSEIYFAKYSRKDLTGFSLVAAYEILGRVGMAIKQRRESRDEKVKILGEIVGGGGV